MIGSSRSRAVRSTMVTAADRSRETRMKIGTRLLLGGILLGLPGTACGPATAPAGDEAIVFDLAGDLGRCEVIRSTAAVLPGTARAARHMVEADLRDHEHARGWYSVPAGSGRPAFAYLLGEASVELPLFGSGDAELLIEGGVPADDGPDVPVEILINDHPTGTISLPRGNRPATRRLPVPGARLVSGRNRVTLRADPVAEIDPGLGFPVHVSAAILSIRISGRSQGPRAQPRASEGAIRQPCGTALRFFPETRRARELVVAVRATGEGPAIGVSLSIERNGAPPSELAHFTVHPGEAPIERRLRWPEPAATASDDACALTLRAGDLDAPRPETSVIWERIYLVGSAGARPETESDAGGSSGAPPGDAIRGTREATGERPSIIVVLLDAAAAGHFGWHGGRDGVTPRIDALAAEGVRFRETLTPAPYTLPSVGSLFTSLTPDRHGVTASATAAGALALDPGHPTLATALRDAGYATAAIVTNPNAAALYGYAAGFDTYRELFADATLWHEGVSPEATTQAALEQIDLLGQDAADRPFLLYVHYFPPHAPYRPPERFRKLFERPYRGPADGSVQVITGFADTGKPALGPEDFTHLADLYDGNLAYVDHWVGALLDGLRQRGLDEKTVVVLCADHGEAFGDHGSLGHGHHLYQSTTRIPLILRWPAGITEPGDVVVRASLLDIGPTLLGLAGVPCPTGWEGIDLLAAAGTPAEGRPAAGRSVTERALVLRSDVIRPSYALVEGPYKYIYDTLSRRRELYDLGSDPAEEHDLAAGRPILAGLLHARLCRRLCAMLADQKVRRVQSSQGVVSSLEEIGYTGASLPRSTTPHCPLLRLPGRQD